VEKLVNELGDAFRGLWRSAVTFILDGNYAETQCRKTAIEALKFAARKLKE